MNCAPKHTLVTGCSSGIGRSTAPVLDLARRRIFRLPAPGSLAS
jgi:NAD(P)-dependent dehydrogenase (short-subunit alcohol dehydrogenase family)